MKLSFTLLLALAPVAKAVDFFPNLRGIAVEVTEEAADRPPGRYGSGCKGFGQFCSTDLNAEAMNKCCTVANGKSLTCAKHVTDDTKLDGKCKESSGDKCYDFHDMFLNCDGEDGGSDLAKCTEDPRFPPAEANCNIRCNWNFSMGQHVCGRGGDMDEEE